MHRPQLSKSTSAATATSTSTTTSVIASGVAQEARQRQQGSFAGMSTTVHSPQSTHISAAEQPFAGLKSVPHRSILSQHLLHTELSISMMVTNTKNNLKILYHALIRHHSQPKIPPPASPKMRSCLRLTTTFSESYRKPCLRHF